MDNRHWLERLREELARRRLPKSYTNRLVRELADHFQDLTEENMSTEAAISSLGEPEQVAEAAARCRPGFFRRHRWLRATTFVILPVPLLIVCSGLTIAGILFAADVFGAYEGLRAYARDMTRFQDLAMHVILSASVMLPAAALAACYGVMARRSGSLRRWALAAGIVLAVFAGLISHHLQLSETPGKSSLMFSLGFPPKLAIWQFMQFVITLAVACLCSRKRRLPNAI